MVGQAFGSVLLGLEPRRVRVTATVAPAGEKALTIEGLTEAACREASVRVRAALFSALVAGAGVSPLLATPLRVFVDLDEYLRLRVDTACLDLAIAVACLRALSVDLDVEEDTLFLGELALDGRVRAVRGLLSHLAAEPENCVFPHDNRVEAGLVQKDGDDGSWLWSARTLLGVAFGEDLRLVEPTRLTLDDPEAPPAHLWPELEDVLASCAATRGTLLVGRPGSGKVMIARRLAAGLTLTPAEGLEVARIYSAGSIFDSARTLRAPFRAPHHTVSDTALVGGGVRPRPGEASLAHRGVLLLDEAMEFRRSALTMLSTVLREGHLNLGGIRMPTAPKHVIATANPCPCGYLGSSRACFCAPSAIQRHEFRLSAIAEMLGLERVSVPEVTL